MLNILFTSQVSQDLPFLHPSETSVLNRLSKLGSDYIRFTEFIEQHTGHVHQQVGDRWASAGRAPTHTSESSCDAANSDPLFSALAAGTSHKPTESDRSSWDLLTGFLHRSGLHAAAVPTSPAGPGTGGEERVAPTGHNTRACQITNGCCPFQFLGDPHLTISHVNYKLDQVEENQQQLTGLTCWSHTLSLLVLSSSCCFLQ